MSDTIKKIQRPLSPHLQVYKLPLTAVMSITHRVTGAGLAAGTLLVTAFLLAAASGPAAYDFVMSLAQSWAGQGVLFLWSAALYYHMCNGVRHMIWDMGALLDKKTSMRANFYVLAMAAALTIATWAFVCGSYAQ